MKNKSLPIVFILVVISCLITFNVNQRLAQVKITLDQERSKRFIAEENLYKILLKVKNLESDLAEAEDKIKHAQTILEQGQSENQDLKVQLEDTVSLKESLEKKIEDLKSKVAVQSEVPAP